MAQHFIVVEVALHNAPLLKGDFAAHGQAQTHDDAALHLRTNALGVDLRAAVQRGIDGNHLHLAFVVYSSLDHHG